MPIALLHTRRQVLEIRQDGLHFAAYETADFPDRVMGLSLSSAAIATLERCTWGWNTGLHLAALFMYRTEAAMRAKELGLV